MKLAENDALADQLRFDVVQFWMDKCIICLTFSSANHILPKTRNRNPANNKTFIIHVQCSSVVIGWKYFNYGLSGFCENSNKNISRLQLN